MTDLNDMLIFAKVAEHGGISSAARALDMPKSKVSRRMAQLEEALGVQLLERSTRSVRVTEAGSLYLQHCQRIADEAESAKESVLSLAESPSGKLRIGTSVGIGQFLLAPHLSDFLKHYPDIDLSLDLNNRRLDLIAEGYDLVVRVGELEDSTLISKRLGSTHAGLFAAPEYLERYGVPESPEALKQHKTVVMSAASRDYQWRLDHGEGGGVTLDLEPSLQANDFATLRTAVVNGAGIGHFPVYMAEELVAIGKLKPVLPEWQSPPIHYYVLFPSHRGLTRKASVWIDFFAERLAGVVPKI